MNKSLAKIKGGLMKMAKTGGRLGRGGTSKEEPCGKRRGGGSHYLMVLTTWVGGGTSGLFKVNQASDGGSAR